MSNDTEPDYTGANEDEIDTRPVARRSIDPEQKPEAKPDYTPFFYGDEKKNTDDGNSSEGS